VQPLPKIENALGYLLSASPAAMGATGTRYLD